LPFFAFVFAASKYVELFDTVLMIVKRPRRNVIFLHWYHHCTVLLFTWYTAAWGTTAGIFFVVVNATVHSFMYYFYFRGALGGRISWSKSLTMLQMTQMVAGIGIGLIVSYKWWVTTTIQIYNALSFFLPSFLSFSSAFSRSLTHTRIHTHTHTLSLHTTAGTCTTTSTARSECAVRSSRRQ
jgi:elongation of very long chain fatty acids protein 6